MTRLSKKDINTFIRQLGEMFRNGVPLSRALDVLADDDTAAFAPVAEEILRKIEKGFSLSAAFATSKCRFPHTLVILSKIGEQTGTLAKSLIQAADWMDEDEDLVRSVKSALTYPALVVATTFGLALLLFTTVVPKLLDVVTALGGELPLATRVVQVICEVVTEPASWLVSLGAALIFLYMLSSPDRRQAFFDKAIRFALMLPILGPTLVAFFHARFCTGFSVLAENGVEVLRAVGLAQEVTGHPDMIRDKDSFRRRVQDGESLAEAMGARPNIYHGILVSFVMLGEESAKLSESLDKAAEIYQMEVSGKLDALKQALEPILTIGVGLLVAFVLVATLLPLYSVLSKF